MKYVFFLAGTCLLFQCGQKDIISHTKPSVILIITDDQGYGDLACHGNPWIKTPQIDKLYQESVRLTDFHVGTTCAPTRSGLLTGRNCNQVGVWHTIMGRNFLSEGEVTLPEILKSKGYKTGIFGKWHLGDNYPYRPQDRGFDESLIHGGGGVGQVPDAWDNDYFDDTYLRNGVPEKFEGYCTDIWFDEAIKFIETHKQEPFFCYLATNAPHSPYRVPAKYKEMYLDNPDIPNASFYGMITNIDENVGKLRAALQKLGLDKNTILIFMTDNGTSAGIVTDKMEFPSGKGYNAGMRGKKGSPYDGGHRVPFFISWPDGKLAHGKNVDFITSYTDVAPTLLELCGITHTPKKQYEGESLASLLRNPVAEWKNRAIITDTQRQPFLVQNKDAAVMTDRYRLVRNNELYDHIADPGQTNDIAMQYPEVVDTLRQIYAHWWNTVSGDQERLSPIWIGFDSSVVRLTSHDLFNEAGDIPAWDQSMVRQDKKSNGHWPIYIAEKGSYSIALHRYPRETGAGFRWELPEQLLSETGELIPSGVSVQIVQVEVAIGDNHETKAVAPDDINAVFEVELQQGAQLLQTWLMDEQGSKQAAYYVYIKRM